MIGGRDAQGNVYCYRNCPVAYQARERTSEPVARFPLTVKTGGGKMKLVEMSMFAIPSYHPALSIVVHVIRQPTAKPKKASALERGLESEAATREPLWPMATSEGEPITLTPREKESLGSKPTFEPHHRIKPFFPNGREDDPLGEGSANQETVSALPAGRPDAPVVAAAFPAHSGGRSAADATCQGPGEKSRGYCANRPP